MAAKLPFKKLPPKVAGEHRGADTSEATSAIEADGYAKTAPTPRKRGQFHLPLKPKTKEA